MITLITCFHGRHRCVERIIRCFLNQDYNGELTLLLYNNSRTPQQLDYIELPENKHIILVNNNIDKVTGVEYTNVGDIFRDAITYVPEGTKLINWFDSDDIFLPNHVSEAARIYFDIEDLRIFGEYDSTAEPMSEERMFRAYKPYYSYYFHDDNQIDLSHNNMEPSIFIDFNWVKEHGFLSTNSSYHNGWLTPLKEQKKIYDPKEGVPTFLYCWQNNNGNHKISGLGDREDNFKIHRETESDHGDGVLSPVHPEEVQKYYDLITNETITYH